MKKPKIIKKSVGISPERLVELRRATVIVSTGSSLRLLGSRITNEEVEQTLNSARTHLKNTFRLQLANSYSTAFSKLIVCLIRFVPAAAVS